MKLLNNSIKYLKTTDKDYQKSLNRFGDLISSRVPLYVLFGNESGKYYDILPSPHALCDFIYRKTTYGEYFENMEVFNTSNLNPFNVKPSVLKGLNDMDKDYVAFYIIIEQTQFKLGNFGFEALLDVLDKQFRSKMRKFIHITEMLNFYLESTEIDGDYVISIKIDPERRNQIEVKEEIIEEEIPIRTFSDAENNLLNKWRSVLRNEND